MSEKRLAFALRFGYIPKRVDVPPLMQRLYLEKILREMELSVIRAAVTHAFEIWATIGRFEIQEILC